MSTSQRAAASNLPASPNATPELGPFGTPQTLAAMKSVLGQLKSVRMAVVGDFVLDRFIFGTSSRISREAPVLILLQREIYDVLGGGANTVANARALGAEVFAIGVVGQDAEGETVSRLFSKAGLADDHLRLVKRAGWATTSKTRILGGLAHSTAQQMVRVDREEALPNDPNLYDRLIAELRAVWPKIDACIISDYGLGVVRKPLIQAVRDLRKERPNVIVNVDSRYALPLFAGMTSMTPNISEVEETLKDHTLADSVSALERRGADLRAQLDLNALLVTRGKFGMTLFEKGGAAPVHIPCYGGDQVADVTGAGDTVIANYTAALAARASFEVAARLSNVAGGLKVMKRGTAVVTTAELEHALQHG